MSEQSAIRTSLPPHGRINCARCFGRSVTWNVTQRETADGWHIINNPMSWGSQSPKFLVLGVSKGTTQCNALNTKPHDQVPFDGFRPKLTAALRLIGLLGASETIDQKICANESDWAVGSMIRCAVGLVDQHEGGISRSGTVVQRLSRPGTNLTWLANCSSAFLSDLPERVRVCVLLSNTKGYVEACRRTITRLRPGTMPINSISYGDGQVTWLHIVHVGGPGKNHIKNWFSGTGAQGRKRLDAQEAVSRALGQGPDRLITSSAEPRSSLSKNSRKTTDVTARGKERLIPSNATRDAIIARIAQRTDIQPHPDQRRLQGTKYISAFRTKRGTAFAIDKMSASKQPVWFIDAADLRSELDRAGIAYELYPAQRGRNSNLHKLSGFKSGALIRAYPETVDEALRAIDLLR